MAGEPRGAMASFAAKLADYKAEKDSADPTPRTYMLCFVGIF